MCAVCGSVHYLVFQSRLKVRLRVQYWFHIRCFGFCNSRAQAHSVYSPTFEGGLNFVLCALCAMDMDNCVVFQSRPRVSFKGAILSSYNVFWFLRLKSSSAYCLIQLSNTWKLFVQTSPLALSIIRTVTPPNGSIRNGFGRMRARLVENNTHKPTTRRGSTCVVLIRRHLLLNVRQRVCDECVSSVRQSINALSLDSPPNLTEKGLFWR